MARLPHYTSMQNCYFITTTTFLRIPCFRIPENAQIVLGTLKGLVERRRVQVVDAVVMPDHLHAILIPLSLSLSHLMAKWKGGSARLINKRENKTGRKVWMDDYFDEIIFNEKQLLKQIEYIWFNPVKKGLVAKPEEYPYSTANIEVAQYIGVKRQ